MSNPVVRIILVVLLAGAIVPVGAAHSDDRAALKSELDSAKARLAASIIRNPGAWAAAAISLGGIAAAVDRTLDDNARIVAGAVGAIMGFACLSDAECRRAAADMVVLGQKIDSLTKRIAQIDRAPPSALARPVPAPIPPAKAPPPTPAPVVASPGTWQSLGPPAASGARQRLEAELRKRDFAVASLGAVRRMALPFYPGGWLVEVEAKTQDGRDGRYSFIDGTGEILLIDGVSTGIHGLNKRVRVSLDTSAKAAAYLRFFCDSIAGKDGPFTIVDSIADLPWLDTAKADAVVKVQESILPLTLTRAGSSWQARATLAYAQALFAADLTITPDGMVTMSNDTPITGTLPVARVYFDKGLRVIEQP